MKEFINQFEKKVLIKGIFALVIYLLWVIWLGNYWFLLGLPIVFDMYLTKKVNWTPWKKRNGKNHFLIEWIDALIFAIIAVTIINIFLFQNYKIPTGSMEKSLRVGDHLYVSKVAYGPRLPNTPLALPFMQNTIPGTTKKSYLDNPHWNYKRLKGFTKVKRWDPVVFNFPAGDTVCLDETNRSFDAIVRDRAYKLRNMDASQKNTIKPLNDYLKEARTLIKQEREVIVRPTDKKDNYIKRCVGIPGDSLQIIGGVVYINGEEEPMIPGRQKIYVVKVKDGKYVSKRNLEKMGVYESEIYFRDNYQIMPLSEEMVEQVKKYNNVESIEVFDGFNNLPDHNIFPHNFTRKWTLDDFGPIYIPKKGTTVKLDLDALNFYSRIIGTYEGNKLEVKDSVIYINGEVADSYTFKMDYYWMMGDNRHSSLDSRYWGYVPEDHIIGRPRFIWLSLHKEKSFPSNIQFNRMFKRVK